MDLEDVLGVPHDVAGTARLRADVVLREDAAGGEDQREATRDFLARRHVFGGPELALAAHELADMHGRGALRMLVVARPLDAAETIELLEGEPGECRREARD